MKLHKTNSGQACRIINNIPVDGNGNESKLYRNLEKELGDSGIALDYWVLSQEQGMGEVPVSQVLGMVDNLRNSNKQLTSEETHAILESGYSDLGGLFKNLKSAFYNRNKWNPTVKNLVSSGIYTEAEAKRLVSNPAALSQVKAVIDKLQGHNIREDFPNLVGYTHKSDWLFKPNQFNALGKKVPMDDSEVKTLLEPLVGIEDRETFGRALANIGISSLTDLYNSDSGFAQSLFKKYSTMRKVRVYKVSENGLERATDVSFEDTLVETVLSNENVTEIPTIVDFILGVPNDIWEDNLDNLSTLMGQLERHLLQYNIDVVGLNEHFLTKDADEVKSFLYQMASFTENLDSSVLPDVKVGEYANIIADFMGRTATPATEFTKRINKYTLIKVKNPKSDYVMFNEYGLIRTSQGLYHKVANQELQSMYETLYMLYQNDNSLLPESAVYPTNKNSSMEEVITSMRRYVSQTMNQVETLGEQVDALQVEKLALYRLIFKHPHTLPSNHVTKEQFAEYKDAGIDVEYLMGEFLGDLQNFILKEKLANSLQYQEVWSKFEFTPEGVRYNGSLEAARALLPDNTVTKNLKYLTINQKGSNFRDMFDWGVTSSKKNGLSDREYYLNVPEALPLYDSDLEYSGDVILTYSADDFIRTSVGVYEKVDEINGLGVYQPLAPIELDIVEVDIAETVFEAPKQTKKLNKAELQEINEKIDNCS